MKVNLAERLLRWTLVDVIVVFGGFTNNRADPIPVLATSSEVAPISATCPLAERATLAPKPKPSL
jgi:hypothetical protein